MDIDLILGFNRDLKKKKKKKKKKKERQTLKISEVTETYGKKYDVSGRTK